MNIKKPLLTVTLLTFMMMMALTGCNTDAKGGEKTFVSGEEGEGGQTNGAEINEGKKAPDWVDVKLIDIDGASRRGVKLEGGVKDIVVHYVANPKSTALQNRNYFNNKDSEVSAHFIVGLDGEVIQCVPLDEKSSASNDRNKDTISIEVCHPDETGKFADATYNSLTKITSWLLTEFNLTKENIIRHYDITGKNCPKFFVENEDAWAQFKEDAGNYEG